MNHRNISVPRSVGFSLSGSTGWDRGMGSAMLFQVSSCPSVPTSFQDWPLAANQEVGQSFHVGGCKTFAAKNSDNFVTFSNYTVEICKSCWIGFLDTLLTQRHLLWHLSKQFLHWVNSWIQWLPRQSLTLSFHVYQAINSCVTGQVSAPL